MEEASDENQYSLAATIGAFSQPTNSPSILKLLKD
jgi:hypothetical protein